MLNVVVTIYTDDERIHSDGAYLSGVIEWAIYNFCYLLTFVITCCSIVLE